MFNLKALGTDKGQKALFYLSVVLVFLFILALNFLTPLLSDDLNYTFKFPAQGENGAAVDLPQNVPIADFGDVLESQYNHYFCWGGRTVAHTLVQTFIWLGKPLFTVANTIAYLLLAWVLFKHIMVGLAVKYPVVVYLLVNLSIWFFAPVFGQTVLWLTGACNYLWCGLIIMSFLLPYRYLIAGGRPLKNTVFVLVMFLAGILAGWCNENTSGMGLLLALIFTVWHYLQSKKLPAWTISGMVGAAIGFVLMISAPGNFVRSKALPKIGFFEEIATHLFRCFRTLSGTLQPLFVIAIIALVVLLFSNATTLSKGLSCVYFVGALACNFAMLLSPSYPYRAQFGTFLPLALSALTAVVGLWGIPCKKQELQWAKRVVGTAAVSVAIFLFLGSAMVELVYTGENWMAERKRVEYILQEKEKGNMNITVPQIISDSPYSPFFEIDTTPQALYYGVESITVLPAEPRR